MEVSYLLLKLLQHLNLNLQKTILMQRFFGIILYFYDSYIIVDGI